MKNIIADGALLTPSKVVCIGRNYVDHIKELNNEIPEQAVIFVKPNSAICDEIFTDKVETIHYEAELSFMISNNKISAVGIGLDLTKRALQTKLKAKGLPWERAKSFDKSAVFSEFVHFDGDLEKLSLQLFINEKLVQQANFDLMIYKPQQIVNEVASFMSFSDGDVLMTGTPKGVGEIARNDHFIGKVFYDDKLLIEKKWTVN
ncbi:fumarylacetoacetate hydrolase family protein [Psychromonas sp. MME2]|uniref:fumarylacetoacetate hydrolase family protein n=1 Tax=Psychromonas sp. MME2 TaxID=3231033 RepID=UPI00339BC7E8